MANDVAELQARISTDLNRAEFDSSTTLGSTNILYDIVSVVRNYEAQRFWFNEQQLGPKTITTTTTFALTTWCPGTDAHTASDIIELDSVKVYVGGLPAVRTYTLEAKGWIELDHIDAMSRSTSGYPQYYAVLGGNLRVYPKPTNFSPKLMIQLAAHVKFPDLAATTDTNCWTKEAKELIRCATERWIWLRRLRDPDSAQIVAEMEQTAYQALKRRTEALTEHRLRIHL